MNELETLPEEPKNEQQPPRSIREQLKEWGFDLDVFEDRAKKARGEAKRAVATAMTKRTGTKGLWMPPLAVARSRTPPVAKEMLRSMAPGLSPPVR